MKQKINKSLFSLKTYDFKYYSDGVDYDYDTEYHCEEYGCNDNGDYCRCSTIENAKVTKGIADICEFITTNYRQITTDIERYCVERILSQNGIWNTGNFEVNACSGYYGEEIDNVKFSNGEKCDKMVEELLLLNDNEKIEYALNMEYGYLLDSAKNKNWSIQKVKTKDVVIGHQDHFRKLNKDAQEYYKNWKFPVAVVLKDGKKYKLIDGYHRFSQVTGDEALVVVGE